MEFRCVCPGPGVPGSELLLKQSADILRQNEVEEHLIQSLGKVHRKLYAAIIKDKKNELEVNDLMDAVKGELKEISEQNREKIGLSDPALRQSLATITRPWMRYFIRSTPEKNLKKVKCPVYALNGDKDLQVAGKQNLDAIEAALKKAKNNRFKCELLPGLNHLFQTSETGAIDEYVTLEETFSEAAMKKIVTWVKGV